MADYTNKIFEMLGVEPEEEFTLRFCEKVFGVYKLDKHLNLYFRLCKSANTFSQSCRGIKDILNGNFEIIKIPKPTAEEQLAIDYARACGYKWLAKNSNGEVYAFKRKPAKIYSIGYWHVNDLLDNVNIILHNPISFLSWEDEEPYYIGD